MKISSPSNLRIGCAPAAATVSAYRSFLMATWLGWLGDAIAGAISIVASLGEAFVHCLQRCSTGAIRFGASTCDTLRHWLKMSTDDVVVVAAMKTENLGTQHVPIILPKICSKHDLELFDRVLEGLEVDQHD